MKTSRKAKHSRRITCFLWVPYYTYICYISNIYILCDIAGCGFLAIYHLGVISALAKHGQAFLQRVDSFGGASSGALIATMLAIKGTDEGTCAKGVQVRISINIIVIFLMKHSYIQDCWWCCLMLSSKFAHNLIYCRTVWTGVILK